ncbi:uncharacterized protein BO97DRAFT_411105 [Aspergillus homomorphus CBS 101889]|uniref:Uncharacterized protein n=1 Tax=Aspergillus homomorphus (strain CBS 101889) TaxID=1450537 RepID=A0A395I7C9_ASPHC|nr:hypothetical protein BO97DRAFT_411105 [Aspergillus homomorphus CBS 101889]RAL15806.1 hypothetical protein BO97DRAFT_411105 [Aspergillus homomorphus CBS 101889]
MAHQYLGGGPLGLANSTLPFSSLTILMAGINRGQRDGSSIEPRDEPSQSLRKRLNRLSIPASRYCAAPKFDDSTHWVNDKKLQEDPDTKLYGAPCNYIYGLEGRFLTAWWLPTHVFHLQPAPGEQIHVDLNVFCHDDYCFPLPAPRLGRPARDDTTYIVSSDKRLKDWGLPHEIKMLFPARLVETLIRLAFRDRYLRSRSPMLLIGKKHRCPLLRTEWVYALRSIFGSMTTPDYRVEQRQARFRIHNCVRNPAFQQSLQPSLVGLEPAWFRMEEYQPIFQDYWKALLRARSQPSRQGVSNPQDVLDHCPIDLDFQGCEAFPGDE